MGNSCPLLRGHHEKGSVEVGTCKMSECIFWSESFFGCWIALALKAYVEEKSQVKISQETRSAPVMFAPGDSRDSN